VVVGKDTEMSDFNPFRGQDFFCPVCGITSSPSKYQEAA